MKRIGLVCLMLIFSIFCFAEENMEGNKTENEITQNSVEEKNGITGFYGIKFATKKDDVKKIMKEKGWKQSDKGVDKRFGDYLTFKNGTYATRKIDGYNYITFYFYEDYFYMSDLFFNIEKK